MVLWRRIRSIARQHQHIRWAGNHTQLSFSQEGEDLVLKACLEHLGHDHMGFYVDIGAYHPERFSNTQLFYAMGWCGINIEPNPDMAPIFIKHRPRDINLTFGISDTQGKLTYTRFDEQALNSFDSELVNMRLETTDYRLRDTLQIEVKRLDETLDSYLPAGKHIDFMSVDAEGFDEHVLRSNNWNKYRPSYLLVEVLDSTLDQLVDHDLVRYLDSQNYQLFAKTLRSAFFQDRTRLQA